MIADLKPYAEYRESGLPWLGRVPGHWHVSAVRGLFRWREERGGERTELLSLSSEHGVRRPTGPRRRAASMDLGKYRRVKTQDLVVNRLVAKDGALAVSEVEGIVSPAYWVLQPRSGLLEPRFCHHLMRSSYSLERIGQVSKYQPPAQFDVMWPDFRAITLAVPPLEEQVVIGRFLDWANGRLERAIRAKRRVIALLNEQKQSIIHRDVTRGLEPSVPLKPSGNPWLGDIPQHWEVRRLRHLIKGRLAYGANAAAEFTNPDWPRYIRITDFRTDGSLKGDTFRSLPPSIAFGYMVDSGDILLARSGATVGKAFLVVKLTGAACHAGYLIRARPNRSLVFPEFLFAFTQSSAFSAWKDSTFNTATIQNIGADKYANLSVPLPSLVEQQAILDSVAVEQVPLLAAMSRLEREIELLREYRTRLVADVVTGKLDVREVAARLPDEASIDTAERDSDPVGDLDSAADEVPE